MFRDPFMVGNIHSAVLSNDSNLYSYPVTFQPEAWIVTASLTNGYILVYPQNGRGSLSFKIDKGRIRIPLHTDTVTIETVGALGYYDIHPVYERKKFDIQVAASNYLAKVLAIFGSSAIAYYPLDETSGSMVFDRSGNARNGTDTAVTLNQPGISDGRTSTLYDGAASFSNVFGASLAAAFNNQEGTASCWAKVSGSGVYTDGIERHIFRLQVDASNSILLAKHANNNLLDSRYVAGAVTKQINPAFTGTDWFHFLITWSKSADQFKVYINGVQSGATLNGLGTWIGSPVVAVIGAGSTVPVLVWSGDLAHMLLLNRVATQAEVTAIATIN